MVNFNGDAPYTSVVGGNGSSNGNGTPDNVNGSIRDQAIVDNAMTLLRSELARVLLDPRRNINHECGYPTGAINPELYKELYDREAIAARVVEVLPKECWQVQPSVYEDVDSDKRTEFEQAWDDLGNSLKVGGVPSYYKEEMGSAVWRLLLHADVLSGLGSYGVIYLAFDDIGKPDQYGRIKTPMDPAPGCEEFEAMPGGFNPTRNSEGELTFNSKGKIEGEPAPPPPYTGPYKLTFNYWGTQPGYWNPMGGGRDYERPNLPTGYRKVDDGGNNPYNPYASQGQSFPPGGYGGGGSMGGSARTSDGGSGIGMSSGIGMGGMHGVAGAGLGREQGYNEPGVGGGRRPYSHPGDTAEDKERTRLLYARVLPEHLALITRYEANVTSERFGMPSQYLLTFNDPRDTISGGIGMVFASMPVHWSRVVHIADTDHTAPVNPYLAIPRMRPILNRLLDLAKVYGADGESWWKNCIMRMFLKTVPQLGGDVKIDVPGVRDMLEKMENGLDRYGLLRGMEVQTVAPQVASPKEHIEIQLEAICIKLGIPTRIFKGSERGELASSQDDDAWNDRLKLRQQTYITPVVICPFIDRLIACGVLPMPGKEQMELQRRHAQITEEQGREPLPSELVTDDMLLQELAKLDQAQARARQFAQAGSTPSANADPLSPRPDQLPPQREQQKQPQRPGVPPTSPPSPGAPAPGKPPAPGSPPAPTPGSPPAPFTPGPVPQPPSTPRPPKPKLQDTRTEGEELRLRGKEGGGNITESGHTNDKPGYVVDWPDLTSQSGEQKAGEASKWVQTMGQYISMDVQTLMSPKDFLVRYMDMDEEEAQTILDNVALQMQDSDTPPMVSRMTMPAIRGLMELLKLAGAGGLTEEQLRGYMSLFFKLDGDQIEDLLVGGIQKPDPAAMAAAGGGKGGGGGGGGMGGGGGGGGLPKMNEADMLKVPDLDQMAGGEMLKVPSLGGMAGNASYFAECERDDKGHCEPEGGGKGGGSSKEGSKGGGLATKATGGKGVGGGTPPITTVRDPKTPPPPGKMYTPNVEADHNGDGVADAARVGVDAMNVPKKIGQLPNLTPYEREVETAFRELYEADPKGVSGKYLELAKAAAGGGAPTFATDDAKQLTSVWTHPHQETRAENRATLNTALHQTANAVAKSAFLQHLDTLKPGDEILVTVGGCGAGKGFALKNVPQALEMKERSKAVWDSAGDQNATENPWIQREAEKRGLKVNYAFVRADPYSQWAHPKMGVVKRAGDPSDGRMVDAKVFADSYAIGARNHAAFHEQHKDSDNANFVFMDNRGKPKLIDGVPKEAQSIDSKHLEEHALRALKEAKAPPHVKRGATVGQRIWSGS